VNAAFICLLGTCLALMNVRSASAQPPSWPSVKPTQVVQTFKESRADTPFLLIINGRSGAPAYKLECHNGNYEDTSEITFSGDFQCALFELNENGTVVSWNLLATDEPAQQRSDWFNRGRMTSSQLFGSCGAVPEYGMVRHFSLRGMLITFQFSDLVWSKQRRPLGRSLSQARPQLQQFSFAVSVIVDGTAQTASAKAVQGTPASTCK
jgi:hypothetical protein